MNYAMVGSSFTILSETPCADPHAGCCGDWGLDTPGYPIRRSAKRRSLTKTILIVGWSYLLGAIAE